MTSLLWARARSRTRAGFASAPFLKTRLLTSTSVRRWSATGERCYKRYLGGNINYKLKQHGLTERLGESGRRELLDRIKHLEYRGYDFETAEGALSCWLVASPSFHPFDVVSYEVNTKLELTAMNHRRAGQCWSAWRFAFRDGYGQVRCAPEYVACGNAWLSYPAIADVRLVDYKVRVLGVKGGTGSKVHMCWWNGLTTKRGLSANCRSLTMSLMQTVNALVDALRLELMRLREKDEQPGQVESYSWGV